MQNNENTKTDMQQQGFVRKTVVRLLYPLLDTLLPAKIALRLKITMNVLAGDWRMTCPYTFLPDPSRRKYSYDDFMGIFSDLDDCSRDCAEKFFFCSMQMPQIPSDAGHLFFYNYSHFKSSWKKNDKLKRRMRIDVKHFQKKYEIECGVEAAHYHHGLRLLDKSLHKYIEGRAIIDVGACNGDSSIILHTYLPSKIFAFEPSATNRKAYSETMVHADIRPNEYVLLPYGLGDHEMTVRFNDVGGTGNTLSQNGNDICKIIPLDSLCNERKIDVGLIKIDIEGMGEQMIRGAIKTIEHCRPLLCLAIYHHASELCETTRFLRERLNRYHFALRCLGQFDTCQETTLIAWPAAIFNGPCADEVQR